MSALIKKPILTEKSVVNYKDNNIVTFEVALSTNKLDASSAVEAAFNVKVVSSTVQSRLGKSKLDRKSRNRMVRLPAKKIMMFKLKKGDKIDIFKA